jgi:lipopolysaccharide/colanic/teichoic acid biosynthesis glycosyltransferase
VRLTNRPRGGSKTVTFVRPSAAKSGAELPLTTSYTGPRSSPASLWWKRPFDLVLCLPLLLVCLPLIGLLGLLVRVDSPGPAFYRQERVGRNGSRFRIWKLRTMFTGAADDRHRQAAANWFAGQPAGERYKTLADPRITRAGRWIRRLDLDELPQLFNVVCGEMSLVGPRPAIPYELDLYEPSFMDRLVVPPGITGLWQVTRRDRLSAPEMMALDLRYVREASPGLDLKTLALTAGVPLLAALRRDGS